MKPKLIFFLVAPIAFLIISFIYIHHAALYFTGGVDPEFNYLFNGITLAHLKLHLNAVGHPGTPIQCLIALVAWIVHLFRPGQSLWDDVILNPDLYIRATVYTANVINAVFLFLLGKQVYAYSKSLTSALVLQFTPFAFLMTLEVSYRLMPELIMTSIISCWIMLFVKIIYEQPIERDYKRYSLLFAILFGFSLADKLTFLPFFTIPLLILPNWKLRLRYTVLSVIAFFIFAFPVLFNFNKFFGWVTDIFTHKGVYGSGERGIIDIDLFLSNFRIMLNSTSQILIPLGVLIILTLVYSIARGMKNITVRLSGAVILLFIFHYAITAKHYAFYYLTPSLLMSVFTGFMSFFILKSLLRSSSNTKIPEILLSGFVLVLLVSVIPRANRQLSALKDRKEIMEKAVSEFKPFLAKDPKIICPGYYGCSSPEYGLLFGLHESGRYGTELSAMVKRHYPATVFYMPWLNRFYDGVHKVTPQSFIKPGVAYTLFIADYSTDLLNNVLAALIPDSTKFRQEVMLQYESGPTAEAVFSMEFKEK